GRANVTFDWQDRFMFRTPSLRNVTLTAPYFHTGAYLTLESAIVHHTNIWANAAYYDPSANLPQSFYSSVRPFNLASQQTTVSPLLADGMPLSDQDVADLVAFLESLTDPAATDLMYITPESVPSGLALDPLPDTVGATIVPQANPSDTVITADTSADIENTLGWQFVDVTDDVGLDFEHQAFELGIYDDPIAMMGGGLCWIDYDNDNRLDLYLVNSHAEEEADYWNANGGSPTNALYRNTADGFVQMQNTGTDLALRGNGCVAGDFNLDGWYDLYITADGDDVLLLNNTDGTFRDITPTSGIVTPEWNSAAAVADVNSDGLPDLFVGGYIDLENKIPNPFGAFPQDYYGIPDRLYIHQGIDDNGNISFVEATLDVGIVREERTLGAIFTDVDRDGDLDLYVANDGQPNRLYENVPDTDSPHGVRFLDLTDSAQVGDAGSGMGVTSADYDGDGFFDLFVTNWEAELNALYRNETEEIGDIQFRYSTYRIGMMGLGNDMTGWGTTWADFDHDTDIDLVTVNGRVPISNFTTDPELVRYYNNRLVQSGRPHYFEFTEQVGLEAVGTLLARGSAVADYDNDGDLDIAINVIGGRAVLLENTNPAGNWLQIQLEDFAPGTVAIVTLPDGTELVREWHTGSSYLASEDPRLHFGLGDIQTSVDLQIVYRGERQIELNGITPNQQLVLTVIRQE
ncbi:MAG: FG-GAP-like repeat-containing protein, partial [Chloroflexota bacterium]